MTKHVTLGFDARADPENSPASPQTVNPEPFHRTPNNLIGYLSGLFFRIPSFIDGAYRHMRIAWGLSGAPSAFTQHTRAAAQRRFRRRSDV